MLKLTGLQADNPQGWMAAIGIMMILKEKNHHALLSWDNLTPILHDIEDEELIDLLMSYKIKNNNLIDNLSVIPTNFKHKITLDFTAGKVNLHNVIKEMTRTVTEQHLKDALFHPWKNTDDFVSLGWDPRAVKRAATLSGNKAPDSAQHSTVLAGQWLAAESLLLTCPLPPLQHSYSWVTWSMPIELESIQAIIQSLSTDWGGDLFTAKLIKNGQFTVFLPSTIITLR